MQLVFLTYFRELCAVILLGDLLEQFSQGYLRVLQPPQPSLNSTGQVPTDANEGREGMQRQEWSCQETVVQPWGRSWVPLKGGIEQCL